MATNRQRPPGLARGGLWLSALLFAMLSLATAGCAGRGMLFTRVVTPYSTDFRATPAGSKTCRVSEHILREPVSGADISVLFTLRVLEDAAHAAGMKNLYYADEETLSLMNGIYERKTVILCGD